MTSLHHHSDTHLAGRVLERIADEHLVPRPRWEFVAKNCLFWALGAFSIALGSFSVAAMLFEVTNVDWGLSVMARSGFLPFLFEVVPFFWMVVLVLFILVGYLNVRRTNRGYRYPLAVIAIGAVLTSLVLGTGLFAIGFGRSIEETIDSHTPFRRPVLRHILDFHSDESRDSLYTGTSTESPPAR